MVKKCITLLLCLIVSSSVLIMFAGGGGSKEVMHVPRASLNADLDDEHKQSIRSLVFLACSALGNRAIVERMLENGYVNRESFVNGWSAVSIAIAQDQHEILQMLLESGCDASIKDDHGRTPVFIAVHYARKTCLAFLHSFNFDMNTPDKEGRTPLMWAVLKTPDASKEDMIDRLLENGADPNRVDNAGFTAFGLAIAHGNENIARFLMRKNVCLQHGGTGPCSCKDGHPRSGASDWTLLASQEAMVQPSLLMLALEKSFSNEFIKELLSHGVPADEMPEPGMHTPLTTAVRQINTEVVLLLLAYGAFINGVCDTEFGMTPLMYAAQGGNERLVEILLEKGASTDLRAKNGLAACDYAKTRAIQELLTVDGPANGSEEEWVDAQVPSSDDE